MSLIHNIVPTDELVGAIYGSGAEVQGIVGQLHLAVIGARGASDGFPSNR